MVTVFMRQQNRVNRLGRDVYTGKPAKDFLPAQTCVDQKARVGGRKERGVACAAAGENANADDAACSSPETL